MEQRRQAGDRNVKSMSNKGVIGKGQGMVLSCPLLGLCAPAMAGPGEGFCFSGRPRWDGAATGRDWPALLLLNLRRRTQRSRVLELEVGRKRARGQEA
jgi:hypothetical protein